MEILTGYVDHITYRNEENGYTVLELCASHQMVTCVGKFADIVAGASYEFRGEYSNHPLYGRQLQVQEYIPKKPDDVAAMERYLGSGAIKGIGAALAARIVDRFAEDTFDIVENEPERLAEVKGISMKKAREISDQMIKRKDLREAIIFLQEYGISLTLAMKIYKIYGNGVYRIIKENPYLLAEDIPGVGFKIADDIARRAGMDNDSDFRIRCAIMYILFQASLSGHTYLPQDILTRNTAHILGLDIERFEKCYLDLAIEKKIFRKEKNGEKIIFSSIMYHTELSIAANLRQLNISADVDETSVKKGIEKIEKNTGISLQDKQREAVLEASRKGVLVITGGPGTGKTTTINAIIKYFELEGLDFCLAAPTGRAAKRMSEMTGYAAKTIHRLLEINSRIEDDEDAKAKQFDKNEENPLEYDAVIIDEVSMIDIFLMNSLLKAIVPGTRLILVGDINQLPSVGPGCVLRDVIESDRFCVVTLDKIFRQAQKSDIIVNAHRINAGQEINLDNKGKDFFFLERNDADTIINVCLQLIKKNLPKYVDAPPTDIQVLSPMRKGVLGVNRLNKVLQRYLNPPDKAKEEIDFGDVIFREGDKVMQIKNDYNQEWEILGRGGFVVETGCGVFNGDIGYIKSIDTYMENMTILFDDDRLARYPFKNLGEIEHAYAITIHKSQGSEYPAVVIPLINGPKMLYNRNLLYTAVTRARKCVIIVGDKQAVWQMQANTSGIERYSALCDRISEMYKDKGE